MTTTTKDEGQACALRPETIAEWRARFRQTVRYLSDNQSEFTSEDIVRLVGLPIGEAGMNRNNAVGAMMTGMARQGLIRKTGARRLATRRSSHGAELTVWTRGTRYV